MLRVPHGVRFENEKKPSLEKPIAVLDGRAEKRERSVFKLPEKKVTPSLVMSAVKKAGIVDEIDGSSLYVKLSRFNKMKNVTLAACCFDDDPYITSSEAVFLESPKKVYTGLEYASKACGAKEAAAVRICGTDDKKIPGKVKIIKAPDRYPALAILKKSYGGSGSEIKFIGAQACMAVYDAVKNRKPQSETVVTVAGDGASAWFNCRVKIGTPLKAVLDGFLKNYGAAVVTGSSVKGSIAQDLAEPVKADTRLLLVSKKKKLKHIFPCIGCGKCTGACTQGIIPWAVLKEMESGKVDLLRLPNVQRCISCAACNAVCPSGIDLLSAVKKAAEIKKSGDIYAAV